MKKLLALITLSAATLPAMAAERPYIGVSAALPTLESDGGGDFELNAVQFRGGSMLSEHLGLEAHVVLGTQGQTLSGVTVDLNKAYSLNAVARMNMGRAGLYGYVGYTWADFHERVPATTFEEEDGMGYGVGIDFPVYRGTHLEIDYSVLLEKDEYTFGGPTVGLRRYF